MEDSGLVGHIKYESEDGSVQHAGKTLTKKGTTDMDRIASQIVKERKKKQEKK